MKYTLRESMILGDVTYLIKTLSYTYQCVLESTQNMGATEVSGMAGVLIDNQINECCRWIEEHDKHVDDNRCRSDGRKRFLAYKVPDDNGVDGVVEHLENISEH